MSKDRNEAQRATIAGFKLPDEHSYGVYKMLQDVYPAFAAKLFQGNDIMQRLVMSGYNCMDILDYPICGKCETLAAFDGYGLKDGRRVLRCTCMREKCGHSTLNPITLRDWVKYELKKKVDDEYFEAIEVAIDQIAYVMVEKHKNELARAVRARKGEEQKIGIIMPDGSTHYAGGSTPLVEHYAEATSDLEDEYAKLNDEGEL